MIKRFLIRTALIFVRLFIRVPFLLMTGSVPTSEGEMFQCFGTIPRMGDTPVKAVFLPECPTLRPLVELLIDSPGFYVMFWGSCFQTDVVSLRQLVVALLDAWGFACFQFKGEKALFLPYIILMIQPFQVTTTPNYLILEGFYLLNTHPAVILPGISSAFPAFIMTEFSESIPRPLFEATRLDGAGEMATFIKVGAPVGKPGVISMLVLGFLETRNTIEQSMTFLKEEWLQPLSLYLPEIISDKAGMVWATSIIMAILPVVLSMMGQESLEQRIAASGIKG